MTEIRIGMPQMAVRGLSENWLFRNAGAAHWDALCASMDVPSDRLVDTEGRRVYSSFVAIRARYDRPLTHVGENDVLSTVSDLSRYGQAIFQSAQRYDGAIGTLCLEMTTKFVARSSEGANELVQTTVRPDKPSNAPELDAPPAITLRHRTLRGDTPDTWEIETGSLVKGESVVGTDRYDPSPYTDYNGAGLLYFASYPTISDTLERRIVHREKLSPVDGDWAAVAGTVEREVYYFGNLDLGRSIAGTLVSFRADTSGVSVRAFTHMTLHEAETGRRLAEIFTAKDLSVD